MWLATSSYIRIRGSLGSKGTSLSRSQVDGLVPHTQHVDLRMFRVQVMWVQTLEGPASGDDFKHYTL